jgi:hypothetical protein
MPFSKPYSISYDAFKFESPDGTDGGYFFVSFEDMNQLIMRQSTLSRQLTPIDRVVAIFSDPVT